MTKSEIPTDFSKADLSNPYFTHHSDHPGLVLISKSLNGDNYLAWKRAMILALNSKNKLGFVNGSIKAPSEEIDPEVWEDLCERFSQSNAPRIFEIQRDIACLRQEQLSVSAYYTKLKGLWDELASYNAAAHGAQQDQQKLMQFLMGLNESYSAIRWQILLMNPLPSVRQAYSSVSQEEKQRLLTSTNAAVESAASAAMAVHSNGKSSATWKDGIDRSNTGRMEPTDRPSGSQNFQVNRSSQGQDGRPFFDQDRRRMGSGRGRPQCSYCGDRGHWVQKCFQLHGYPPDHPKARMNLGSNSNRNKSFSVANQVSEADEGKPAVALSEAQLKQLLSLLNNQDENSSSKVNADLATRRTIGLGKQHDRLYYLVALATEKSLTNHSSSTNQPTCNLAISSTDLWHSRLGHHSCVYMPQQNRVVERKHRHILQVARALKFHAQVPTQFWGECALTAVHIINRLPSPVLSFKTPFELLYSKPPSCSHLRVFGCLAYATNVHTSHKFDYRAMPSIFIGYPVGQKAYKLFDLSTKKIDPNPSPPPSTTLVLPSPVPPFASISSAPPAETPIFSPETHSPKPATPLRRSSRHIAPLIKLHDYVCSYVSSNQSSSLIPGPTKGAVTEPRSYSEAAAHPKWQEVTRSELQALQANDTWSLTPLPAGKTPIGCRWVYKIKQRSDGFIERYKARLVAKGFTQLEGVDYQNTFSPTTKIISVRCLLALAAACGWSLHQMDVNNAFLHGDLHEEIYMSPPLGLRRQEEENLVCRLHKSLYGLKQASRQWFAKFSEAIQSAGYAQSRADYSLFTRKQGKSFTALLIYVDDILITGNDPVSIATTKKFLRSHFHLKDLGDLKYFLGIEVFASKNGIFISQCKYALEIIEDTGLLGAAPIDTPMERGLKLSDKSDLLKDQGCYRRLVGRLIYLTVSRPDITYAVHVLSRFMHQPRKAHMEAAFRVVRYLKNAPGQGLFFSSNNDFRLRAYCDSDWAGCPLTRRSTTGYYVFLGPSLISWRSKRQKTVSLSSVEAEYRAMTGACCELTWLRYLLKDLGVLHQEPTLLYCDNKAALHIVANPVFHECTRHIEMDCHYIRDKIQDGSIITRHVSSAHQLADILTKPLGKEFFAPMIRKLGVQDIHSPT
ncbi:Retrovirus-related Pol polyprotein from transposon RE1 [Vitis vinifera]|uniref:Retrovirus-related Pol polyprotein from transposon RE1 n=1 Tax=Vitis vinifera TaxID=29760 RepID=A0A438DQH1_VITVI|nr:Retrovirus-related Pol polyprotein from transposon RE1 [Vitis vinifera]